MPKRRMKEDAFEIARIVSILPKKMAAVPAI
jgi:hypothetical protein